MHDPKAVFLRELDRPQNKGGEDKNEENMCRNYINTKSKEIENINMDDCSDKQNKENRGDIIDKSKENRGASDDENKENKGEGSKQDDEGELTSASSFNFRCLQHGDTWHNNFMFHRSRQGLKASICDWQVSLSVFKERRIVWNN